MTMSNNELKYLEKKRVFSLIFCLKLALIMTISCNASRSLES